MYPRSARFDNAVRFGGVSDGATPVSIIDAYRAGQRVASDLPWVSPSAVTVDESASAWRTCEVTVASIDPDLVPKTPQHALGPYGTDLYIRTGFRYGDGTVETVPMGVFRLLLARPTRKGRVALLGYDYSRVVARARFEVPRVFPRGYGRARAITDLIQERTAGVGAPTHEVLRFTVADDATLPLTIFEEGERYGDPWKACTDLAEGGAQQVFFAPDGPFPIAILRPSPDLSNSDPVWIFQRGEGSTLIDIEPEMDTTTGYNVYVVTGESSDLASLDLGPVRASAEVTDASSPIYPPVYGRVPTFFASSFMRTTDQCQQVANANLPLKAGGSEGQTVKAFAHPAHEGGDVVRVFEPDLGIASNWVFTRFTIDLSLREPAAYACRAKRVT